MANTVIVGCKLPSGLIITVGSQSVALKGFMKGSNIIGGYGMTENVDEKFFDAWVKANKDRALVKKGLIFKAPSKKEAAAQASDNEENKSGLEQIDPNKAKDLEGLNAGE